MDIQRHERIFNPKNLSSKIAVIGVGATGSALVISLVRLGISPNLITVFDDDNIEQHNIANQQYYDDQKTMPKVEALQELCGRINPAGTINIVSEKVTGETDISEFSYVFLLVDCMDARSEIMENIKKGEFPTFVFETRTDAHSYRVYSIDTGNKKQNKRWLDDWYPNDAAAQSMCGSSESIIDIIENCASYTIRAFINRVISVQDSNRPYLFPNKSIITLNMPEASSYEFWD